MIVIDKIGNEVNYIRLEDRYDMMSVFIVIVIMILLVLSTI